MVRRWSGCVRFDSKLTYEREEGDDSSLGVDISYSGVKTRSYRRCECDGKSLATWVVAMVNLGRYYVSAEDRGK